MGVRRQLASPLGAALALLAAALFFGGGAGDGSVAWLGAAAVVLAAGFRFAALRRRGDADAVRLVYVGLAWFLVSLLPLVTLEVDLNNANGERLMFLSTVGLALMLPGLIELRPSRRRVAAGAGAAIALLGLSLLSAYDWVVARRLATRVVGSALTLAPGAGQLVLLDAPENYRSAHVFTGDLDGPLSRAGRSDLLSSVCSQTFVWRESGGAISFDTQSGGSFDGHATWSAPFDVPVLRSSTPLAPTCSFARLPGPRRVGLALRVRVTMTPASGSAVLAYFDGRDLKRCC
jgi:hypothetical protein